MTYRDLKQRVERLDPAIVDLAIAIGLTALVCAQIWLFSNARPEMLTSVPNWRIEARPPGPGPTLGLIPYVLASATFMALAVRRQVPWLALTVSCVGAGAYALLPFAPPAPTIIAPVVALYTFTSHAKRRHTGWVVVVAAAVITAGIVLAFSSSVRWVAELTGMTVMLAAAALLGESERTRGEYLAEYKRRALEAERTREEEALRRVDEERIRIAREVHDIVAHGLSIVTVQANAASALVDKDPGAARESIEHVRATSKQALAELRSLLDVLRTGEGELPLTPVEGIGRIEQLAEPLRDAGIAVEMQVTGSLERVPAYASVSAYRIVQEALTNVVRHAAADAVTVSLHESPDWLEIVVTDTGTGAGVDSVASAGADLAEGHGIRGMRERVEALGGSFVAGPADQGGFRVRATIPLTKGTA